MGLIGCGVSQELYNTRTTELDKCQAELSRTQNEATQTHTRGEQLKEQVEQRDEQIGKLQAEAAKLAGNLSATEQEMAALRRAHAQAEQRAELYRGLEARLHDAVAAGTLTVELRKGRMLVRLPAEALFDSGLSSLRGDGQKALREVAQALKEIPDRDFLVCGHTDNQPLKGSPYTSNWDLSTARAVTVVRFLQSEGVDPRHLAAAGYSEFDNVADNGNASERGRNRRIEVVIMPRIDELPSVSESAPATVVPPAPLPVQRPPATSSPPALAPPTP
jgi:chemotaxis protein MotB